MSWGVICSYYLKKRKKKIEAASHIQSILEHSSNYSFFLKKRKIYLFYFMCRVLLACIYVQHTHIWCLEIRRGRWSPGTGVIDSYEPPQCWERNPPLAFLPGNEGYYSDPHQTQHRKTGVGGWPCIPSQPASLIQPAGPSPVQCLPFIPKLTPWNFLRAHSAWCPLQVWCPSSCESGLFPWSLKFNLHRTFGSDSHNRYSRFYP